jgi:hypothetical protein
MPLPKGRPAPREIERELERATIIAALHTACLLPVYEKRVMQNKFSSLWKERIIILPCR